MTATTTTTRRRLREAQAGFTLIEVLIAMLITMVGLLGTVAVQQSALNAAANVNDAQVAMRLATTSLEQFNTRKTQLNPFIDMLGALADGNWSTPVYLDTQGRSVAALSATNRWRLRTRVSDVGRARPYNISVEVMYSMDNGNPKYVQLDVERMKTW